VLIESGGREVAAGLAQPPVVETSRRTGIRCANLDGANLTRAVLTNAVLTGVDLRRADLTRTVRLMDTKWSVAESVPEGLGDRWQVRPAEARRPVIRGNRALPLITRQQSL